jgi:hydrogenase maturation factor HypF (carbamoyltransferase family)
MECQLHIVKIVNKQKNSKPAYRFAVVDNSKSKRYPANFVCMLPVKVESSKEKSTNTFGDLFGDESADFAVQLLNKALIAENNTEIKSEIEKRLTLLLPKQVEIVKCSECQRPFQKPSNRKYKHPFCTECYGKRFSK